jgi:cell division protein FtsB
MAQKQTVEIYRKQNKSLKIDNQMLKDKNSELESGGK